MKAGISGFSAFEKTDPSLHQDHEEPAQDGAAEPLWTADSTPMPPRSLAPDPPMQTRLLAVRSARNPLLEAAQPLLRALAEMPDVLTPEDVEVLHRLLLREVESFQSVCNDSQIRHEHMVGASYALCTAIDERAHSTRWGTAATQGGAGVWAGRQLAVVFHDDARGGDKVFLLIGRLVAGPDEHIDLIEVIYFILGLGFEGRYGAAANGRRQLETIRHRLYALLATARAEVPHPLSPQWLDTGASRASRFRFLPPWVSASISTAVLILLFGTYKYRLLQMEADSVRQISSLGASSRKADAAKPVKALRLKELLANEITRGTVDVEEDGARSTVRFRGDEMFVAGQARLSARIVPVLETVAAELSQVPGSIEIAGHSDNRPVRTGMFRDNQALSERRAAAVAEVLEAHGVDPHRLKVQGRADKEPIADNATAAGRARNRRVEIVVKRRDPSGPADPSLKSPAAAEPVLPLHRSTRSVPAPAQQH